jgi:hypothetical protein
MGREYRRSVWSRVRADILRKHTPTHLFWGVVPVLASAGVGLYLALRWGPATFSPLIDIGYPLLSGLAGLLFTLVVYVGYHRWQAPQRLYQDNLTRLAETQAAHVEAKKAIEVLQQKHAAEISSVGEQHACAIAALRRKYESAVLTVTAFTDSLSQQWGPHLPVERSQMGLLDRRFAILRVVNEGHKNLPGVVASCQFADVSIKCIWSLESEDFAVSGRNTADLNVGAMKLLVVAQGFGAEGLWARLPTTAHLFGEVPLLVREASLGKVGRVHFLDHTGGEMLDLGADVLISVRMKGVGIDQTMRFRLWFNRGEPAIDAFTAPPPADRPSSTASE